MRLHTKLSVEAQAALVGVDVGAELGLRNMGMDPSVEASLSFGRFCFQQERDPIMDHSDCPMFMVGIPGPWVIKFVQRFNRNAHRLLGLRGFTPDFLGYYPLRKEDPGYEYWAPVAVEHVESEPPFELHRYEGLPTQVKQNVREVLQVFNDAGQRTLLGSTQCNILTDQQVGVIWVILILLHLLLGMELEGLLPMKPLSFLVGAFLFAMAVPHP
ncbi:hypothetical protein PM082_011822 [Marasmius tenuissimus]|nr:hypothetical protein PM082_011822 [Marasmius tenuissimus]